MSTIPDFTEPVPVPTDNLPAAPAEPPIVYDPTRMGHALWTNLQRDKAETPALITQALGAEVPPLSQLIGKVMKLSAVITHPIEMTVEGTGELVPAVRMVLIDVKGDMFACVSMTALTAVGRILHMCGDGPWFPPLEVAVSQARTRKGYIIYNLTLQSSTGRKVSWGAEESDKKGKRRD